MPAASGGKRSMKSFVSRGYEGASASQKVRAAEWEGTLRWNNTNHPSSKQAGQAQVSSNWTSNVDYNFPWFELRDQEYYCNLCGAWATEGHVESAKHKQRAETPEWYGFGQAGAQSAQDEERWNKPWYTRNEQGEWYCQLCGACATQGHVESEKHKKREAAPEWYGFNDPNDPRVAAESSSASATQATNPATGGGQPLLPPGWEAVWSEEQRQYFYFQRETGLTQWDCPAPVPQSPQATSWALVPVPVTPPELNFPWFERRPDGEWYCLLCNNYATDGHLASSKHTKRAEWPGCYGFPEPSADDRRVQEFGQPPLQPAAAGGVSAAASAPGLRQANAGIGGNASAWLQPETCAASSTGTPAAYSTNVEPSLPPGWTRHFDHDSQQWYYHNQSTGETTWDCPGAQAPHIGGLQEEPVRGAPQAEELEEC